ncbi:MAG: hypothetical protein HY290_06470 [Planctomycetia bacterium]|nr:hypothetical protein [Planctomycetia bacterium]
MLNWRNVSLIFHREVRDQLRDRRTLFMIAVLPLLLYPALGLGMMRLSLGFREQPQTVAILGAENLPDEPALLEDNRFAERWFRKSSDRSSQAAASAAGKLIVISDLPGSADRAAALDPALNARQLLERAQAIGKILENGEIQKKDNQRAGELFGSSGLKTVVIVPAGFAEELSRVRDQLAKHHEGTGVSAEYPRPAIRKSPSPSIRRRMTWHCPNRSPPASGANCFRRS